MSDNIKFLLKILKKKKCDFYIISTFDEHLNEYPPERNRRLKWLTNFSGSNGIALISERKKIFFTDGRYILQAKKELCNQFEIIEIGSINFFSVLIKILRKKKLLIDFKIFKIDFIKNLKKQAELNFVKIVHDKVNSIDQVWIDRPVEKKVKAFHIGKNLSGEKTETKLNKILKKNFHNYLIINSSESVCWLLNIRGCDLAFTPVVLSRMIIFKNKIKVFMDKDKIPEDKINNKKIYIYDLEDFDREILKLPKESSILLDEMSSYYFFDLMIKNGFKPDLIKDPCELLRSQKNKVEIENSRKIHVYDGLALIKYFFWLENQKSLANFTELSLSNRLENFRRENKSYFSPSFETISAAGSSGSIIHYNPKGKKKKLIEGQLYLCDSGGQYFGGTTDVTRTKILGNIHPKKEYILNYTRVLMGHINLSLIKFPIGTRGCQLDSIARMSLWQSGLDYNHGTGHGVGSFLGVHEGPQSISKKSGLYDLKEGMILSNEPGFYKNDKYGIRIENLILVKKSKIKGFLEFETLTLCPYEINLIDTNVLSDQQINWLNSYHLMVYKKLSKSLNGKLKNWLYKKTRELK